MEKKFSPEVFLQQQFELRMPDGQPLDIPIDGAIGLLALGDVGIIAWRQKIRAVKTELALRTQSNLAQYQSETATITTTEQNEQH